MEKTGRVFGSSGQIVYEYNIPRKEAKQVISYP